MYNTVNCIVLMFDTHAGFAMHYLGYCADIFFLRQVFILTGRFKVKLKFYILEPKF